MMRWIRSCFAVLVAVAMCAGLMHRECSAVGAESAGSLLAGDSGLPGGICVTVGGADAKLPLAIAENERFVVQALYGDPIRVDRVRRAIREAGVYGRVSADRLAGPRLPYTDNLVNMIVVEGEATPGEPRPTPGEILRVLAPLGVAYLAASTTGEGDPSDWTADFIRQARGAGCAPVERIEAAGTWLKVVKRRPDNIDEWTHFLHGSDGNPVADDRVVGPPRRYQWVARPTWAQSHETDTSLRCLVSGHGRLYFIVNEVPPSLPGPESPPDEWFLAARDAFNGVLLWKVPIKNWGWRQWKPSWFTPRPGVIPLNLDKRLVAAGENLFVTLGFHAPVSEVDGRNGTVLRTFAGTAGTSETLYLDGSLILTIPQDGRAIVKRIDVTSGRQVWQTEKSYLGTTTDYYRFSAMRGSVAKADVAPTLDIATDGQVVALLDGDSLVGLNFSDGRMRWRTAFPLVPEDAHAGRIDAVGKVWNGAMIVSDGMVVHASPYQLAAFSAATGDLVWHQPKKFLQHLWYEWQDVFLIDGLVWTWSAELIHEPFQGASGGSSWPADLNGYDLHTGRLQRQVALGKVFKTHHHHRCYRDKATVRYVIASRRGSEFIDLNGGEHSVNNWVRGACHMGMMPANGLQYAPPHPCQCYIDEKLNGFNALASATLPIVEPTLNDEKRLQHGPAQEASQASLSTSDTACDADWPTFRSDAARSGFVHTTLPDQPHLLWQTALNGRPGAPTSVGDRVFVPLVDQHQVVALRATDGAELWRFTAGARIDSPPTFDRGALLFGSADGWVYRVSAADGRLIWRLRGVPADRRIAAFGQLESAWPVSGSLLVHDGIAYFDAGRSSHLDGGMRLVAVDARSGKILHETKLVGPRDTSDNIEQNYQRPMGLLPDILRMEDGALFMRAIQFDTALTRQSGVPRLQVRGGFLDDAYFKRMPWSMGKSGFVRVLVYDADQAYCLRMFDSLQGLDPKVYFTPGKQGYLLFACDFNSGKKAWAYRVPIRGRALAVTDHRLVVAGPPDVVDRVDPWAAFEGRKGGVLRVVDKDDGHAVGECRLTSPPVFNGIAAANGRLLLTLEDGHVVCLGKTVDAGSAR